MKIIFYYPATLKENADSASGIRPRKMLEAFKKVGFEVDEVFGYNAERAKKIARVKRNVEKGIKYAFAYGENTTLPFALNNPSHVPSKPILDYSFWRWLKKERIPFGCFYRDVYWRFPILRKNLDFQKWAIPLPFHYIDVFFLKHFASVLFFPSEKYAECLPFNLEERQIRELPPGCELASCNKPTGLETSRRPLNCFYVGAIIPPIYDISPMLGFFSSSSKKFSFTLCCRKNEWEKILWGKNYGEICGEKLTVIHESGPDLEPYWDKSSLFLALWSPSEYRKFAVPYKIFDALGHCKPIITTKGTAVASFVEENGFGWTIKPCKEELGELLNMIFENPGLLDEKKQRIIEERHKHTWEVRALSAAENLLRKGTAY